MDERMDPDAMPVPGSYRVVAASDSDVAGVRDFKCAARPRRSLCVSQRASSSGCYIPPPYAPDGPSPMRTLPNGS